MPISMLAQILALCLIRIAFSQDASAARAISYYHGLGVHITPEKPAFPSYERLRLRVEFRNEGPNNIRVGREVKTDFASPFRLAIKIEDSQGHIILEPLEDPVELPCVDLRESDVHNPKIWVELAPHSTYSQMLTVYSRDLAKVPAGSYRVTGHYRSFGVLKGGHCLLSKTLESKDGGSTGLEWEGEVDTNAVWIKSLAPGE